MSTADPQLIQAAQAIAQTLRELADSSSRYSAERLADVANEVMANHTSQFSALCAALRGAIASSTPGGTVTTSATGEDWQQLSSAPADFFRGDNNTGTALLFRKVGTDVTQRYAAGAHVWIDCDANTDEWEVRREDNDPAQVTFDYLIYEGTSDLGDLSAIVDALEAVEDAVLLACGSLETINTTVSNLSTALTAGASVGDDAVTTDATGTAFATLTSASALSIQGTNNTGASLTFKRTSGSALFIFADGAAIDLPCAANANEWQVKRTDESTTQVTFGYIRRY